MKDNKYPNDAQDNSITLFDGADVNTDNSDNTTSGIADNIGEEALTDTHTEEVPGAEAPQAQADSETEDNTDTIINEDAFFSEFTPEENEGEEESTDADEEVAHGAAEEDEVIPSAPDTNDCQKQTEEPEKKARKIDSLFDIIEIFVFTLAAVFIITSFFFRYSVVNGGSMMNTLQHNERLLLTNFLYSPKGGDIVVVQDKSTALKDPIVKRVIAVGGERVKITKDAIYVNGTELTEDYVYVGDAGGAYEYSVYPSEALMSIVTGYEEGVYYEITVPKNEIFVMGDHRNDSTDSRKIGTLHEDAIIGKVVLRFYPFKNFGKVE